MTHEYCYCNWERHYCLDKIYQRNSVRTVYDLNTWIGKVKTCMISDLFDFLIYLDFLVRVFIWNSVSWCKTLLKRRDISYFVFVSLFGWILMLRKNVVFAWFVTVFKACNTKRKGIREL